VTIDGASSMIGKKTGFMDGIRKDRENKIQNIT
jgi:hypothetical protein